MKLQPQWQTEDGITALGAFLREIFLVLPLACAGRAQLLPLSPDKFWQIAYARMQRGALPPLPWQGDALLSA